MKSTANRIHQVALSSLLITGSLLVASVPVFSRDKNETIEATSFGTGSQMGQVISISVTIYDFSTPDEKQVLVQAFDKAQNQGLVNALTKMKAVGRIAVTGTLGYDLSYIRSIPTPTGRKIRFVTNRQLTFGEVFTDSQSQAFNLTAGEFDINDTEKKKSTGTLFPAARLVLDKEGQLQLDLNQNSWRLEGVLDWKGTPGVN